MTKKHILPTVFIATLLAGTSHAAIVTFVDINWDGGNGIATLFKNQSGTLLSNGVLTTDGDGFALQLGYFNGASAADNFAGAWVPLTGFGTLNTQYSSFTVGDGEGGAGEVYGSFKFEPAVTARGSSLPVSATIPLSIRFYNAATVAAATFFNTVSSDTWLWRTPANDQPVPPAPVNIQNIGTLEYQSIAMGQPGSSAALTTIPVPEPTSAFLVAVGAAGLMMRRRRQS